MSTKTWSSDYLHTGQRTALSLSKYSITHGCSISKSCTLTNWPFRAVAMCLMQKSPLNMMMNSTNKKRMVRMMRVMNTMTKSTTLRRMVTLGTWKARRHRARWPLTRGRIALLSLARQKISSELTLINRKSISRCCKAINTHDKLGLKWNKIGQLRLRRKDKLKRWERSKTLWLTIVALISLNHCASRRSVKLSQLNWVTLVTTRSPVLPMLEIFSTRSKSNNNKRIMQPRSKTYKILNRTTICKQIWRNRLKMRKMALLVEHRYSKNRVQILPRASGIKMLLLPPSSPKIVNQTIRPLQDRGANNTLTINQTPPTNSTVKTRWRQSKITRSNRLRINMLSFNLSNHRKIR